jgi:hypothetical protein
MSKKMVPCGSLFLFESALAASRPEVGFDRD